MDQFNEYQDNRPGLRIQLLSKFSLYLDGQEILAEQLRSRRVRNLISLLALTPYHRLHREQVIDALWPDSDPAAAANNFHQTLYGARRLFGNGRGYLSLEDGVLSLWSGGSGGLRVDTEEFTRAAESLDSRSTPEEYLAALALYHGELLPEERYTEWTLAPRETLAREYRKILVALAALYEKHKDYTAGIETLKQALSADPLNEEVHTGLMRLYARSGQRQLALRQYQVLRDALRKELEVEPGEMATRLFNEIQSGKHTPVTQQEPPAHNLPEELTSFIGREEEISALKALLLGGRSRLVTVIGTGGTGKTRLALRAARELVEEFEQGAWLVELAALNEPALIASAAIHALGALETPGQDPGQVLVQFLRGKRLLLVLDNCEHLVEAAARLGKMLLASCPRLVILATSRELLRVAAETTFYCPSLALPEEGIDTEELRGCESVRLFLERAALAQPGFALNEHNAAGVAQICRRLDGIPLALEMAAAALRLLPAQQIAARLEYAFQLLTRENRAELPRHRTLRAAFDWSYQMLDPLERALLLHLSVFRGGWQLEAAEAICSDEAGGIGGEQVLGLLGGLVDKSLVVAEPSPGGEMRYRLLEPVRQYARDRMLEISGEDAMRQRHLDFFLRLSQEAEPNLRARGAKKWLDRLDQELDNLRLALEWAMLGQVEKGLQLAASLHWFWWGRGHIRDGVSWLSGLLAAQTPAERSATAGAGRAANVLGFMVLQNRGEFPAQTVHETRERLEENLALFRVFGEVYRRDFAITRFLLAETVEDILQIRAEFQSLKDFFWMGQCDESLSWKLPPSDARTNRFAEECLAISQEINDLDGEGWAYANLAKLEIRQGKFGRVEELFHQGLRIMNDLKNENGAGVIHSFFAYYTIIREDYPEARRQLDQLFSLAQKLSSKELMYDYYCDQLLLGWATDDPVIIEQFFELAESYTRDFPAAEKVRFLYQSCRIAISRGEGTQARKYLQTLLSIDKSYAKYMCMAVRALGVLLAVEGKYEQSAVLFASQDEFYRANRLGMDRDPARGRDENKQALAADRAALGKKGFALAWEKGKALSMLEAIKIALKITAEN